MKSNSVGGCSSPYKPDWMLWHVGNRGLLVFANNRFDIYAFYQLSVSCLHLRKPVRFGV